MKKILLLQGRPEKIISESEFKSIRDVSKRDINHFERYNFWNPKLSGINIKEYSSIIVLGSPYNILDNKIDEQEEISVKNLDKIVQKVIDLDFPYFGMCYGLTYLIKLVGNSSYISNKIHEPAGVVNVSIEESGKNDALLKGVESPFQSGVGHKESVVKIPKNIKLLGSTDVCKYSFIKYKNNIYGSQFHIELTLEDWKKRVNTYKNMGYFKPEEVDTLVKQMAKADLTNAQKVLNNFLNKYSNN